MARWGVVQVSRRWCLCLALLGAVVCVLVTGASAASAVRQSTRPLATPRPQEPYDPFKQPELVEDIIFRTDSAATQPHIKSKCPLDLALAWSTELESSVYSSPLLFPLHHNGAKQIILPTYWQHVELLEHDGHKPVGWPVSFEGSKFHSSPLLYDIDGDGREDIVVADGSGQVVFMHIGEDGQYLRDFTLTVPKLGVKHDWADGLDGDGVDASMQLSSFSDEQPGHEHGTAADPSPGSDGALHRFRNWPKTAGMAGTVKHTLFAEARAKQRGVLSDGFGPMPRAADGSGDKPARRRTAAIPRGRPAPAGATAGRPTTAGEGEGGVEDDDAVPSVFMLDDGHVLVDAHILTTPVITDLDGDGAQELLVGVSYFFDPDTYADEYTFDGDVSVDPSNYAATAIVCYDLARQRWRWQVHLDLSKAGSSLPARMYAPPTVADLEADGKREVIVATMAGNVYVLGPDGRLKEGFPIETGSVQAQVLVEDLANGAELEMLVADDDGTVSVLSPTGKVVWSRKLSPVSPVAPAAGDVDGDGQLEVVVTSRDGGVWALDAETGLDIDHFPVRTGGRIMAPTTLLRLDLDVSAEEREAAADGDRGSPRGSAEVVTSNTGLQLVVPNFDGHVYVIAGATGCTNKIDIGEHVYAAVMAEDLSQDGMLELVVGTMNGNVLAFATGTAFHPLNSQPQYPMGGNSFAHRLDYQGVYFVADSHLHRNIIGETVMLEFAIVDERSDRAGKEPARKPRYAVSIMMGRQVLFDQQYDAAGTYSATFTLPRPQLVTLQLRMENEHGQIFWDVTTLTFNTTFYRLLKWMVALPMALAFGLVVFLQPAASTPLPS